MQCDGMFARLTIDCRCLPYRRKARSQCRAGLGTDSTCAAAGRTQRRFLAAIGAVRVRVVPGAASIAACAQVPFATYFCDGRLYYASHAGCAR